MGAVDVAPGGGAVGAGEIAGEIDEVDCAAVDRAAADGLALGGWLAPSVAAGLAVAAVVEGEAVGTVVGAAVWDGDVLGEAGVDEGRGVAVRVGVGAAVGLVGEGVGRGVRVGLGRGAIVGVGLGVAVGVGFGVGRGVGFGVGRGVGFGVGRGVGFAPTTVTTPVIAGWISQWYENRPARRKVAEYESPI